MNCPVCRLQVERKYMVLDIASNRMICGGCHRYIRSCSKASGHNHREVINVLTRKRRFYETNYDCF